MPRTIANAGIALIQRYESCARKAGPGVFRAYPDPCTRAEPWTIGWGSTGVDIGPATVWTQQQCDARFAADLDKFSGLVAALLGAHLTTQNQFDALTSFAYNLGVLNLKGSTLLRLHLAGDFHGAEAQFSHWNHAGGVVLDGLTKRRAAEAALYGTPDGRADMPTIFAHVEGRT